MLFIQVPLAWYMLDLPLGLDKLKTYSLHRSLGIVLLTLGALRILRAIAGKRPKLPAAVRWWQKLFGKVTQWLLYLLVVNMPVTGWLLSSAANVPVTVFGLFTLPPLVPADEARVEVYRNMHATQSEWLLVLVGIHFLAALQHQFLLKDNVLFTMLPLKKFRR